MGVDVAFGPVGAGPAKNLYRPRLAVLPRRWQRSPQRSLSHCPLAANRPTHDWSVETEAAQRAGGTVVGPFSSNSVDQYQTGHTVGAAGHVVNDYSRKVQLHVEGSGN